MPRSYFNNRDPLLLGSPGRVTVSFLQRVKSLPDKLLYRKTAARFLPRSYFNNRDPLLPGSPGRVTVSFLQHRQIASG